MLGKRWIKKFLSFSCKTPVIEWCITLITEAEAKVEKIDEKTLYKQQIHNVKNATTRVKTNLI